MMLYERICDNVLATVIDANEDYVYVMTPTAKGISKAVREDGIDIPDRLRGNFGAFRISQDKLERDYRLVGSYSESDIATLFKSAKADIESTNTTLPANKNTMGQSLKVTVETENTGKGTISKLAIDKFFDNKANKEALLGAFETLTQKEEYLAKVAEFVAKAQGKLASARVNLEANYEMSSVKGTKDALALVESVNTYLDGENFLADLMKAGKELSSTSEVTVSAEEFLK